MWEAIWLTLSVVWSVSKPMDSVLAPTIFPSFTHILLDEAICGVANQKDRHTGACSGRVGAQELICKWLQPAARVEELPVLLGPDRLVEHLRSPSRVHRSVIILLCHQENQA